MPALDRVKSGGRGAKRKLVSNELDVVNGTSEPLNKCVLVFNSVAGMFKTGLSRYAFRKAMIERLRHQQWCHRWSSCHGRPPPDR